MSGLKKKNSWCIFNTQQKNILKKDQNNKSNICHSHHRYILKKAVFDRVITEMPRRMCKDLELKELEQRRQEEYCNWERI